MDFATLRFLETLDKRGVLDLGLGGEELWDIVRSLQLNCGDMPK